MTGVSPSQGALWWLERGATLIRLRRHSKDPVRGPDGSWETTTDAEQVRRWFAQRDTSYGVVCGLPLTTDPEMCLVALDSDAAYKPGGRHLPEVDTVRQRSARGGTHALYVKPLELRLSVGNWPGLDIKGGGGQGYVVGAGSQIKIAGETLYYRFFDGDTEREIARLPEEFARIFGTRAIMRRERTEPSVPLPATLPYSIERALGYVPHERDRSAALYNLVRVARRAGFDDGQILDLAGSCAAAVEKYGERLPSEVDRILDKIQTDRLPVPVEIVVKNGHAEPVSINLPDDFWAAHERLDRIRQAAHSRYTSADAVLGATLARLAAYCTHDLKVPYIVAGPVGLTFYVAAVGPPSSGKSAAWAVSGKLLPPLRAIDNTMRELPVGSGEGIAEAFMGQGEEPVTKSDGSIEKRKVRKQVRHNALFVMDEGQSLTAFSERNGSTIGATLRTAWTGGVLGQANADEQRRRIVEGGSYAVGLYVGFQPVALRGLLADAATGTPQRFVFFSANDPSIADEAPSWPGGLDGVVTRHYDQPIPLGAVLDVTTEVRVDYLARQRGEKVVDLLDAHRMLARLKTASLLAVLLERDQVDALTWELSEQVLSTSDGIRAHAIEELAEEEEREKREKDIQTARRQDVSTLARDSLMGRIDKLAERIARAVHAAGTDGLTRRDIHRLPSKAQRQLLESALGRCVAGQWVITDGERWRPGARSPDR